MLPNTTLPRDSRELWKHFSDTYFSLRVGLAVLAFAMPFVLYLYGTFGHGLDLQPSMSAYFWAAAKDQCATFPMRTIFVGFLFAIGIGLYVYKGLTPLENSLLNAAAFCAVLVAIFPERLSLDEAASDQRVAQLFESCPAIKAWATLPSWPIHYIAATILFVLLAIIAWSCANKSLEFLPTGHDPAKFRRTYRGIAIAMILFPIVGFAASLLFGYGASKVFFIEAAGIVTFGVYWTVKSRELALSDLERDPAEALEHAAQRQAAEAQAVTHSAVNAKT
ncbi:hypothetical protein [Nitrospira sp. BLG_2]|uniref:hypothetical protein n=1 Tax=Nitrospira sp. BLG_2 TaxID=3397507 RepID=UPI003B9AD0BE